MIRRWTAISLRRYALTFLGVSRLPRGLPNELRYFRGQPAYTESLNATLRRYLRWEAPDPWPYGNATPAQIEAGDY